MHAKSGEPAYSPAKIDVGINPENWFNSNFAPTADALRNGYQIGSVEVPYSHPTSQTALESNSDEFRAKRRKQYRDIVINGVQLIRYFVGNEQKLSRLKEAERTSPYPAKENELMSPPPGIPATIIIPSKYSSENASRYLPTAKK